MRSAVTISLGVAALFVGTSAWAGGGAGLTIESLYYPRYGQDVGSYTAPGVLTCAGLQGLGITSGGVRIGGEASHCRGRAGVTMTRGGLQIGGRTRDAFYWTVYTGLGMGVFRDITPSTGSYTSLFAYLRPTAAVGISTKIGALELGVQALTTVNVVQWVGAGESRGFFHPTIGAHAAFFFGNMTPGRRTAASDQVAPPQSGSDVQASPQPLAIPSGLSAPPPAPPAPSAPLAVPVGGSSAQEAPVALPATGEETSPAKGEEAAPPADTAEDVSSDSGGQK